MQNSISYHAIPYHTIAHLHTIPYHIISCHIIAHLHFISYHIIPCPYHTIPVRISIPYHTIPYHTISFHAMLLHPNIVSFHLSIYLSPTHPLTAHLQKFPFLDYYCPGSPSRYFTLSTLSVSSRVNIFTCSVLFCHLPYLALPCFLTHSVSLALKFNTV